MVQKKKKSKKINKSVQLDTVTITEQKKQTDIVPAVKYLNNKFFEIKTMIWALAVFMFSTVALMCGAVARNMGHPILDKFSMGACCVAIILAMVLICICRIVGNGDK